jgi:hypothetical protein
VRHAWVGSLTSHRYFAKAVEGSLEPREAVRGIQDEAERFPYLFSQETDGDTYEWLGRFGPYSPIIHLQQTDGRQSAHLPFTEEQNAKGIIEAGRVLSALRRGYERPEDPGFPPRCTRICMTLEIFSAVAELNTEILAKLEESIAYWRRYIPADGRLLNEIAE